jgi:hypothetical protein
MVRAFETWASQAVLIGTLAGSPHRQQFECQWCEQGWYRDGYECLNPAKVRHTRVYPCVERVRGWHQRWRYEPVPGEDLDLEPEPNPVEAYCRRCKAILPAWSVNWESEYRKGEWKVEGQPVLLQVPEAIRSDVKYLKDKSAVQWTEVWARRAQAKAAIRADNAAWMMEEKLAQMKIDSVIDDGSVNLGCEGASVLDNGY